MQCQKVPEPTTDQNTLDLSLHNLSQFNLTTLLNSEVMVAKMSYTVYKNTKETLARLLREGTGLITIDKNHQPLAFSILFALKTKLGPSFGLYFFGFDTNILIAHIHKSLSRIHPIIGTPQFGLFIQCPVNIKYKSVQTYLFDEIGLKNRISRDQTLAIVTENMVKIDKDEGYIA